MAATSTELLVKLVADAKGFAAELGGASKNVDQFGAKLQAFGRSAQDLGRRMSLAITLPIAALAKVGYDELVNNQKAMAQTEAAIRSTGGAANVTAQHVADLGNELQDLSGTSNEVVQEGANLLLTFTNIRNEAGRGNKIFDRATRTMLDMSIAMGQDASQTAIQLGKALQDPILGMTALRRVGVAFTKDQQETIKKMVETGNLLGAQKLILRELNTEFGGSAKAFGETLPGQIAKAKESWADMSGLLLAQAAPAINAVAKGIESLSKWVQQAPGPVKGLITAFAGLLAIGGPLLYVAGTLARSWASLIQVFPKLATAMRSASSVLAAGGWLAAAAAITAMGYALVQATHKSVDFTEAAKAVSRATDEQQARIFQGTVAIERMTGGLKGVAAEQKLFSEVLAQGVGPAERLIKSLGDAGYNTDHLEKMLRKEIAAQKQANADGERSSQILNDVGGAGYDAANGVNAAKDAFDQLTAAQFDVEGSSIRMEQAVQTLNQSVQDGTADTLEGRNALLSAKQSVENWGGAVYENAILAGKSQTQAKDEQVAALSYVAGTMAPGSPLRVWLDDYINRLNGIPRNITTNVTLQTIARTIADNFEAYMAEGGSVAANKAYIVGEKGPELFIPNSAGEIIPNDALGTVGGGKTAVASGGGGPIVAYLVLDGKVAAEAVFSAANRAGGPKLSAKAVAN